MWELLQSLRSSFNCGNYCKVQDLLLIVGTTAKFKIFLLNCGNYCKIQDLPFKLWELLQSPRSSF
ncbi:hypothetical protein [Leptospira noguchii]|uniref:Uncharacterized protein n=1 Tax=Leptospira noguchii TaxID=28182 RepID=A0AAE9GDA1_9LEPT|nr:hypothetical protein [Leptospira noguchii]UOG57696.1 hypothetical protein MAL03_06085 [Leptospira noguchii]